MQLSTSVFACSSLSGVNYPLWALRHYSAPIGVKGSLYSITERSVPELIPVLGSQPACDVSHKPGGRLPLLSVRPSITPATPMRAASNFAA